MGKKIPALETEPIFNIHIDFCDGSRPVDYFNLNLMSAATILQNWSEDWILIPRKDCLLNGKVWLWDANVRHTRKKKDTELEDDSIDIDVDGNVFVCSCDEMETEPEE